MNAPVQIDTIRERRKLMFDAHVKKLRPHFAPQSTDADVVVGMMLESSKGLGQIGLHHAVEGQNGHAMGQLANPSLAGMLISYAITVSTITITAPFRQAVGHSDRTNSWRLQILPGQIDTGEPKPVLIASA